MEIPFSDAEGSYSFIYSVLYVSRKKNLENNIQTNKQNQNHHHKTNLSFSPPSNKPN